MRGWHLLSLSAHWMAEHSIGAHCAGWSRVTDNDPPAIGARLAYGYGVCSAITMVERELTVLGRTVTASGAMLETMTHLGERLSPFDINAAPISASTDAGHPHDGRAEQWGFTPERPQTSATDWPSAHEIPKPQVRSDQAQPPRTWTIPRPDGSLIRPRHVAGQNATTTPRKAPQLTTSTASLVPSAVAVPATPASVNPLTSVAPPNLASSPSFVTSNDASTQSLALQVSAEPVAAAPETTSDEIEAPQESSGCARLSLALWPPAVRHNRHSGCSQRKPSCARPGSFRTRRSRSTPRPIWPHSQRYHCRARLPRSYQASGSRGKARSSWMALNSANG